MINLKKTLLAAALFGAASLASAAVVSPDVAYHDIHGSFDVNNAKVVSIGSGSAIGNVLNVAAGSALTLSFDAILSFTNKDYCPYCIIQHYVAWNNPARDLVPDASGQINVFSGFNLNSSKNLGSFTWNTFAPTQAGTYFIGGSQTLDYSYKRVAGGPGINGDYSFQVNVAPVPEPETYALMGLGLVGLLAARRRKNNAV